VASVPPLEGVEETMLASIQSLIETMKTMADQAMTALKVPGERYRNYWESSSGASKTKERFTAGKQNVRYEEFDLFTIWVYDAYISFVINRTWFDSRYRHRNRIFYYFHYFWYRL
jgi:hypothetical protein